MRFVLPLMLAPLPALADPPEIIGAEARRDAAGWVFSVTLAHPDTGWEHYADGWEILSPQGERLGLRDLLHPHVHEQPFTRSLSGVIIPEHLQQVLIRARCSRDGWTSAVFRLRLSP